MISVLYVDDEPDLLEIGKLFLERDRQFSVATSTSAGKAIEALQESSFDAIISDFQMPEMNGIDFLKIVRSSGNTIPFIIFTGRGREEIVIQALNEGADFYIQKGGEPVSQFAELAHKIRKAVMQKRAEASIHDHERRETDIINFLPDATFAIDTNGVVIAWNRAMEKMTGVSADAMLQKGNYEYALPFYHERRPILIDLVLHNDPVTAAKYPTIKHEGNNLFSEITIPHFNNGEGAALWFTASPLYDTKGNVVGAIESIREITERKQAEEALYESEKRFRDLADLLPQAIYEADANGTLKYANRRAFDLFGYSTEEFRAGINVLDMVAPEDRNRAKKAICTMLDTSVPTERGGEFMARKKDGTTFPVSIYSSQVILDGRITGFRGVIIDISERRRAEETIAQSEIRFRSLIQNASDMIRILDRGGTVVYESPSTEAIMGYPVGKNIGKDPLTFIHPDDLERVKADLRQVYDRTNPGTPTEFRARKEDGTYLWVDTIATNMLDVPAVNGIVITTRPIEQRKRLENAIRESEEKYRLVVENSHDAIYIHRDDRLLFVNARASAVTGYTKDELLKKTIWDLVHPDDRAWLQKSAVRRLAGEDLAPFFSARLVTKTGYIREGEFFVDRVDYLGSPAILGIFRDITEQNQADRTIRESEERYRTIFENTGTATIQVEEDLIISKVNTTFERMTGYTREEIEGKRRWTEFVHPDDLKKMIEYHRMRREPDAGAPMQYEFRLPVKDGTEKAILLSVGLIPGTKKSIASLFDLTDQKRTKDDLIAANQEYINLLSQIQDVYYRSDTEGRLVKASQSWATLLGYEELSECIGRSIADDFYFSPADRNLFLERISREGKVTDYEVLLKKKDGSPVLVSTSSHLTYDSCGNSTGIEGTFRDITEKKRIEEALRSSEERYRNVVEDQTEFISRFRPDGTHVFVNEAYCRTFGLSRDEILGHRFRPKIPEEDREQVRRFFKSLTPDHPVDTIEHRIIMPDGSVRWQRWSDRAIFDDSGTIVEYQSVGRDVTEKKEVEESLRQTNIVVENSPVVIFRWKAEEGWPVVNVSKNVTRFGYTPEELLSGTVSFSSMIHPEDLQRVADEVARYSKEGIDRYQQEYRILTRDGRVRWVDDRTVIERDPDGRITHYQGIFLDSTEQKQAEADLVIASREFNEILNQMQDVFYRTDAKGTLLRISRSMAVLLGYHDISDLIGKDIAKEFYFNPADRIKFMEEISSEGKVTNYEILLKRKDGVAVPVSVNSHLLYEPDGTIGGIEGTFRDITEQRRAADALKESEQRYRSLSEASRDLIFVIDRADRVTYVNSSAATMLGISAQEIIGRKRSDLFPPEVSGSQGPALSTVFETGKQFRSTGQLNVAGRTRWFDHALVPVRDATGSVSHVLGISRDVSELKTVEEALRQKTDDLDYRNRVISTILDTVPIGILMVEATSGKPIIANNEATRLLGRGIIPDATRKNAPEVYEVHRAGTATRYPAGELPIVRGMNGESHHIDDIVVVRPDGTSVPLEVFGTPVIDRQGHVSANLVSFLDITERKRAEEALQSIQEKYTKAFLSVPDAITISELDTGRFIEVNDAATALFGYPREELIGRSAVDLGIWLKKEDRTAFIARLEKEGRVHEYEVMEKRKSGELYNALINADTLTIRGRKYLIAILRDITERKKAEQVISEANRKINLLTSITRHDVANQVSILKGYAQIAQVMNPAPPVADLLKKIEAAGSTIARQVEFTRTYQDLGMQAPGWYRVSELIAKQKSGDVRVTCTCSAEIYADPMLEKVFFNLIDNAVRHGERVTEITVTCAKSPEDGLVLSVEDNGIGVPAGLKEKIFEKGFGKNTGFGLFLAQEILAITGITIRETGTEGNGARFEIIIPEGVYRTRQLTSFRERC